MKNRTSHTQETSAAKAGISVRSGRRIEKEEMPKEKNVNGGHAKTLLIRYGNPNYFRYTQLLAEKRTGKSKRDAAQHLAG